MSSPRSALFLSKARYCPYDVLLSPVRALRNLMNRATSSSTTELSLGSPTEPPRLPSEDNRSCAVQLIQFKDTSAVHEPALGNEQPSQDPTKTHSGSKSAPDLQDQSAVEPENHVLPLNAGIGHPKGSLVAAQNIPEPPSPHEAHGPLEDLAHKLDPAPEGEGVLNAQVVTSFVGRAVQGSEVIDKSVSVVHGSDDLCVEENLLEDGEVVDVDSQEDGEIVDVDPEPLTEAALHSLLRIRPMLYDTPGDRCLHWLGRMEGEVMEEEGLFEKTWHTAVWSIHSFTATRGVRIYNFFDTIQSGYVTYSPPLQFGPRSRWNFYPEHVTTTITNRFERTAGDIEFRIDGDGFKYYVWSFLFNGDDIRGDGEVGKEHPEHPGYYLHHHYNQPPMWLFQPRPRPPVNFAQPRVA